MTDRLDSAGTARPSEADREAAVEAESAIKTSQGRRSETVRSGTRWTVAAQMAVEMSRLVVQLVLARLLLPGDFGIVTLGMATIVFLDIFATLGTAPAIVQRPTMNERLLNSMFFGNFILGCMMTALYMLVAPYLASSAGRPESTTLLRVLGLAVLVSSCGIVHQGLIRRQLRFRELAKANIIQTLISGVISVTLAFSGFGAWSLVWGQLAGRAVLVVLMWRAVSYRPRRDFAFGELKTVKQFTLNITAFSVSDYFFMNSDRFLVGQYLGASSLGIYGLGQQTLMTPVRSITRAVQQVLFPTFARIQDDDAAIGRGYLRACAAIAALTFPAMAGLTVLAGPLIRTLFDSRWVDAIPVVTILAPIGLLHSLHFTTGVLYTSKGRADWQFRWGVGSGVLTVAGYVVGLRWGITGVAGAYAVVVVLLTYPAFAIPFRLIGLRFRDLVRAVAPFAVATAVMSGAVWAARIGLEQQGMPSFVVLMGGVAVGMAVYLAWIFTAKPQALTDLMGVVNKGPKPDVAVSIADAEVSER